MSNSSLLYFTVHPRLRGELLSTIRYPRDYYGSSPLTRGTPVRNMSASINMRFIPAYAGNSIFINSAGIVIAVHPRLRGELGHANVNDVQNFRFIPAYAGNSGNRAKHRSGAPVHPRLRGELRCPTQRKSLPAGSSPLTRGTQGQGRD